LLDGDDGNSFKWKHSHNIGWKGRMGGKGRTV
jgi:hypothetical protein